MASIYQQSYVTLAATVVPNGSYGLFRKREAPLDEQKIEVSLLPDESSPEKAQHHMTVYVRKAIRHFALETTSPNDVFSAMWGVRRKGPERALLKRGWVCQERLLSPQTVHFAEDELVGECRVSQWCERGRHKAPPG